MTLNNEKLTILNLRFNLKRHIYLKRKMNAEAALLRKKMRRIVFSCSLREKMQLLKRL